MPTPSWLGRDSNGILRDFTGEDVDETAMPAEVGGGSNESPFPEPFVIQSGDADESVLHVEATNAEHTGNLLTTQNASGGTTFIGPLGNAEVRVNGELVEPVLLVNPQNLDSDPTADLVQVRNNWGNPVGGVTKGGFTYIRVGDAGSPTENAPADAELVAGQLILWFDDTDGAGKLMIKAKTANGTVRTGSVNLT